MSYPRDPAGMTADIDDLRALLALILAGGPLPPRQRLLASVPRPAALLERGRDRDIGLDAARRHALHHPDPEHLRRCLDWLAASPRRHLVWLGSPDYPPLLASIAHPPLALFLEGDPGRLWQPSVAVVGSRAASHAGRGIAAELAIQLCGSGLQVASGLAAGIDAAAHAASLDCGAGGMAVIGTGPDICYPAGNRSLHQRLVEHGLVASEYAPGTPPRPPQFPARNRILAGLSLAVIVVEAAQRSGALVTARLAAEAGREVFAVPGSILNSQARGCHRLLREGAGLLESVQDLLPTVVPLAQRLGLDIRQRLNDGMLSGSGGSSRLPAGPDTPEARTVWAAVEHHPVDMDELALRTGLTVDDLSSILVALELEGWVTCQHGRYLRPSQPTTPIAPSGAGRG